MMSVNNLDNIENEIFSFLRKIGCCFKCALRFCGIYLVEQNIYSETFLSKIQILDDEENLLDTNPCVVCLGILQNHKLTEFTQKVMHFIEYILNDCSTVSLNLSVPTAIQIREKAVHIYLSLHRPMWDKKIKIQNIKEVWKWFLLLKLRSVLQRNLDIFNISSSYNICINMSYLQDQIECSQLIKNFEYITANNYLKYKHKKFNVSRKNIEILMNAMTDEEFAKCCSIPPTVPTNYINIDTLQCKHINIFVGGRYVKFSRKICQTPWIVDGESKITASVQEIICDYIRNYSKSENSKFLSSGREDVDVRMLLSGRPFAIELINPKNTKYLYDNLFNLTEKININNEKIKISNGLKILTKLDLLKLKEGEYSKSKSYRALCICKKYISITSLNEILQNIMNLKIIQNTPIRVLHRRAACARERIIYEMRARSPTLEEINKFRKNNITKFSDIMYILFDFKTQAGTYVKEFVHGDFGRTVPSLCTILKIDIDIIALDVTHISMKWP